MKIDRRSDIDSEELERLVREEIDWQFYEAWLTDRRIPEMYERHPEKELKEEAYSIFFKSFDDILETIGIPVNKKIILHLLGYPDTRRIDSWKIVDHAVKEQQSGEDFKYDLSWHFILFRYKGIKYKLGLSSRVALIVDFLVTKGVFEPFLEEAKTYKRKTLEERIVTLQDGRKIIERDKYNYIKYWGTGIGRDLNYMQKRIWNPEIEQTYSDEKGQKSIGG